MIPACKVRLSKTGLVIDSLSHHCRCYYSKDKQTRKVDLCLLMRTWV